MRIFVLYDPREDDALLRPLLAYFACKNIVLDFFPCVLNATSTEMSINLSHKRIVQYAKDQLLPEVCILEADCWFPAENGWEYFLQRIPERFDLYLGGIYGFGSPEPCYTSGIAWPLTMGFSGMHCYIIQEHFYDNFLDVPDDEHIDFALSCYGKGDYYVCYPFAAIQRPGKSANNRKKVDYNTSLREQDVHGDFKPKT